MLTYPVPAIIILLLAIAFLAAFFDIRSRRIPNWLTVGGTVIGLAINFFLFDTTGLISSLKGLGLAFLIYFPLFAIRAMGAGDVKLMACIGAIVGPSNWLGVFFLSALLGGPIAIVFALARGRFRQTLGNTWQVVVQLVHLLPPYRVSEELDVQSPKALTLPHGAVVALGVVGFIVAGAILAPKG